MRRVIIVVFVLLVPVWVAPAAADETRVAVATNFLGTLQAIVTRFEQDTPHRVHISSGSSGKLFAQIQNGAPFDAFFSADALRPALLEQAGLAVKGSRFTYAVGQLTLWSPDPTMIAGDGPTVLAAGRSDHLAIANPMTAPYGAAAKKTLEHLQLWESLEHRIVQGENIGQTFQFVYSRNAQLGFVARSQVLSPQTNASGSRWDVPASVHNPLEQQAVLLVHGEQNQAARTFLNYVTMRAARTLIERFGYDGPPCGSRQRARRLTNPR